MANPYDVERSWPDYFLEHRKRTVERQGTYRCGELPVWTVHHPLGMLGNSTIIEGDDGLIVYDTGVNGEAGAHIAAEIAKVSDKPVKAIFYSHHHADHYNGTAAIVDPADVAAGAVAIYAWENFEAERKSEFGEILPRQVMGIGYYGGAFLPPEDLHHHGIGTVPRAGTPAFIPPTHTLTTNRTLDIAGITINAFYTGGEAISEFGFHLPEFDMVIIADEFFTGLPNMHSIRGSKPRVPDNYVRALDRVIDLEPEWLLGSHIEPMQGSNFIAATVTRYRDATQYLWDQSIRLINKGYTPVELQHALKDLPDHLVQAPYSVPLYGTPFTTVPEFFTGWVSWFSGDATDLFRTEPATHAAKLVDLMGGGETALDAAKDAHRAGDHQFAAELAQLVVRADPDNEDGRLVKAAALRARGYQELNPIARSWYLTGALELEGEVDPNLILQSSLPMFKAVQSPDETLRSWRYLLDAEAAGSTSLTVGIRVPETGAESTVRLRNSVIVVQDGLAPDADAVVEVAASKLAEPVAEDATVISGDPEAFARLVGLLDTQITGFYMHQR